METKKCSTFIKWMSKTEDAVLFFITIGTFNVLMFGGAFAGDGYGYVTKFMIAAPMYICIPCALSWLLRLVILRRPLSAKPSFICASAITLVIWVVITWVYLQNITVVMAIDLGVISGFVSYVLLRKPN